MPFEKGQSGNPEGRAPGVPNKLTKAMKEALEEAFERAGGVDYLVGVAKKNPKAFCTLLGKLLPKDVTLTGADGKPIIIQVLTNVPQPEKDSNGKH